MSLVYVSSNIGKWQSVKKKFNNYGMEVSYANIDLEEPDIDDITFISKEKARQAYEHIGKPVFVIDSGFYIHNYPNKPNYPGVFVKRSGVSSDIEKLLETLKDTTNRDCHFLDCLTFYDGDNYYTFYGRSDGMLANEIRGNTNPKAKSRLWFLFIPQGYNKTLAQMTDEEIDESSKNSSATIPFIHWYQNTYLENNKEKIYTKR